MTCNFGLSDEQFKQATEAAVKGATGPLIDRIADISKTLGVTEDALGRPWVGLGFFQVQLAKAQAIRDRLKGQ